MHFNMVCQFLVEGLRLQNDFPEEIDDGFFSPFAERDILVNDLGP